MEFSRVSQPAHSFATALTVCAIELAILFYTGLDLSSLNMYVRPLAQELSVYKLFAINLHMKCSP